MSDYIENTKINLCDTCKQTYPECPAVGDDITFGDGVGNDNVCKCRFYETEEEPMDDLISRQAAIDALENTKEVAR